LIPNDTSYRLSASVLADIDRYIPTSGGKRKRARHIVDEMICALERIADAVLL
jgi:hypothetical protein